MTFRRSNHREERRRRVLMEEPGTTDDSQTRGVADSPITDSPPRYADAALSTRRCRVSDLVPLRWWVVLAWFGALISCAAGMQAVYRYVALSYTRFDISQLPAIDLSRPGNIATWFSSILLLACGAYGILIYQIRRHRVDDYRGRYRLWRWMVPVFLLASIDQVASIQESLAAIVWQLVPLSEHTNGLLLWHGSMAVVAAVLAGRLVIEMHACRLASLMLTGALGCFAVVLAARAGWLLSEASVQQTMWLSGLVMGSRILLLMAILLYARHVHRDAHAELSQGYRERRNGRPDQEDRDGTPESEEDSPVSSKGSSNLSSKPRTSRTRTQDGKKVVRADPAHASRKKSPSKRTARREQETSRDEAAASSDASESCDLRGGPSRRATRSGTAGTTSGGGSSPATASQSGSRQPDDDDTADALPKLSKAERKRLRKQRRQQRQAS